MDALVSFIGLCFAVGGALGLVLSALLPTAIVSYIMGAGSAAVLMQPFGLKMVNGELRTVTMCKYGCHTQEPYGFIAVEGCPVHAPEDPRLGAIAKAKSLAQVAGAQAFQEMAEHKFKKAVRGD